MTPRTARAKWVRRAPLLAALLALGAGGGWVLSRLQTSQALAALAQPLSAHPDQPARRLLVVGDSTAVGTGASSAQHSVPGLIAADHPDWRIDNRAVNGARFADVVAQLQAVDGQHDLVLILAGGNDVMRMTSEDTLRAQLVSAMALAHRHAPAVVLMPCGDVGHAPFFFPPVSWLMSRRSAMLHRVVAEIAARTGARYVRLLKPRDSDPFAQQPGRLNAADGLHPSDQGYRVWYAELQAQGGLAP